MKARRGASAALVLLLALPALAADDPVAAPLADLGQALLRQAPTSNAVISPVATAVALGLVQAGAQGPAEHEIEALLGGARAAP